MFIRWRLEEIVDVGVHVPCGDVAGVEAAEFIRVLEMRDAWAEALEDYSVVAAIEAVAGENRGVGDGGSGGDGAVGEERAEGVADED